MHEPQRIAGRVSLFRPSTAIGYLDEGGVVRGPGLGRQWVEARQIVTKHRGRLTSDAL